MNDLLDSPNPTAQFKFKLYIPLIWLGVFVLGYCFRYMHWPFNSWLRMIGFAGFAAYNFNAIFRLKGKQMLNNVFVGLSVLWIVVLIWGAFFNGGYPFNFKGLTAQFIGLIVLSGVYLLVHSRKKKFV